MGAVRTGIQKIKDIRRKKCILKIASAHVSPFA
jgi:hypothetical protein